MHHCIESGQGWAKKTVCFLMRYSSGIRYNYWTDDIEHDLLPWDDARKLNHLTSSSMVILGE
jgi:hypothetical protein